MLFHFSAFCRNVRPCAFLFLALFAERASGLVPLESVVRQVRINIGRGPTKDVKASSRYSNNAMHFFETLFRIFMCHDGEQVFNIDLHDLKACFCRCQYENLKFVYIVRVD